MRYWMLIGLLFSPALWAADQADDTQTAQVAHFQDSRYGYAAANLMHLNLDYDNYELTPSGLMLRLGGMVDENWGVELRVGTGPSGDTRRSETSRNKVDYTVDHVGALLATGKWSFDSPVVKQHVESFFVQGFAGVADVKVKTVARRCNAQGCRSGVDRNDDTSLAFGAALGMRTAYNIGLSLQYMQYVDKEYITVSGIEGGLEWYF
ncbi:outer membrane beta-barrel protein [Alcanivorax sp. DP30]|uniref:outer membrane beta-barrel protein n=1 Tax=Alcanivorax sp. DP30 TaxID=2606217 RepID=UPI00136AB7C1|nr:outer membrane beta-barrel protein [Alcanivorax sp. DP30]MZR63199.1 porin family protein [Alcanivorax sp. DP30]